MGILLLYEKGVVVSGRRGRGGEPSSTLKSGKCCFFPDPHQQSLFLPPPLHPLSPPPPQNVFGYRIRSFFPFLLSFWESVCVLSHGLSSALLLSLPLSPGTETDCLSPLLLPPLLPSESRYYYSHHFLRFGDCFCGS